jgi:general secretion pathway protein D
MLNFRQTGAVIPLPQGPRHEMPRMLESRISKGSFLFLAVGLGLAGCHKGNQEFKNGKASEAVQDLDTAVTHYQAALKADPQNTEYQLKYNRLRFEAAQQHVETGQKLRQKGDLQMALTEFQRALMIDPASPIARQEIDNALEAIAAKNAPAKVESAPSPNEEPKLMTAPPELKPTSRTPITINMTADAKLVFDAAAKLAGLSVIFDPDFISRRITVTLSDVTIQQVLDVTALQAKAFWKPLTNNIIFVAPDQPQKRKDYEEEIVKTIYLKNTMLPQDLTEIVTGLRQLLDIRRIQQFNAQNAIIIRATPDLVLLAEKVINSVDKPKSEVVIQFAVLQTRRDRIRDLGISPSTTASLTFTPPTTTSSTSSSNTAASLALNQLQHLSTSDYSVTLPNATATALLTDNQTQVLEDPEIRVVEGQDAKLRIGDRVPIATGSFQAGVGTTGINPLVNTQFQYLDVGVIIDVTPRVHVTENEVSLKLSIEVSSVTGTQSIGGINQPVISTRKLDHDVRLQDGEVNVLGGLIERTKSQNINGWPGFSSIPFLKYFTSTNNTENEEQEVLIVVIPHIVRTPNLKAEDLRSLATGTETTPEARLESIVMTPEIPLVPGQPSSLSANSGAARTPGVTGAGAPGDPRPAAQVPPTSTPQAASVPRLHLDPSNVAVKQGSTAIINVVVDGASDLYSIPLLLQYDPKILAVDDVRQGGFLTGGAQPVAIVQRIDKERGQAIVSATRMANTPGISGSGNVYGVVVRGIAPGTATVSIVQVNDRDSKQQPIQFVTGDSTVTVAP